MSVYLEGILLGKSGSIIFLFRIWGVGFRIFDFEEIKEK